MIKMTKKILSLILASALVLTMSIGVFAADDESTSAKPSLVKTLDIAEGVTVPDATFNFKLEELSALTGNNDPTVSTGSTGFTAATTISAADAAADGGKSVELESLFEDAKFPHAGIYAYKLTEEAATYTAESNATLTCNTEAAEYTVIVVVQNNEDGTDVEIADIKIRDKNGEKADSAAFNNKYVKKNTENDKPLTISKTVAGGMGDKESDFTFKLTITAPTNSTAEERGTLTAKIGDDTVTVNYGENEIKLAHGETLTVTGILFGSTYQVVEAATDTTIQNYSEYTTEVSANGGTATESKDSGEILLSDDKDHTVAFTNTLDEIPVTGVIMNTLPYILIVAVAAAAFVYMQMKKRV